jgi:predicted transcriptional regulator
MNFAQMLLSPVTPLSEYQTPHQEVKRKPERTEAQGEATLKAQSARRIKTIAKYKAVMGKGWMTTREIETRLGSGHCTAGQNLYRYLCLGLVDRRNAGGTPQHNRRKGYEWRFL